MLELVWRTRSGGGGRTYRKYLDFVIDGQSLHDILQPGDLISCLGWLPHQTEKHLIEELLLRRPSELKSQRYMLYICPECGDIGCGAITVQIEKTQDSFVWKDFRYEDGYSKDDHTPEEYAGVGPFQFNKTEYWQKLNRILSDKPAA